MQEDASPETVSVIVAFSATFVTFLLLKVKIALNNMLLK